MVLMLIALIVVAVKGFDDPCERCRIQYKDYEPMSCRDYLEYHYAQVEAASNNIFSENISYNISKIPF